MKDVKQLSIQNAYSSLKEISQRVKCDFLIYLFIQQNPEILILKHKFLTHCWETNYNPSLLWRLFNLSLSSILVFLYW